MLKKEGVTTVDEEGDVNDLNAAALALGGPDQRYLPAGNDGGIRHLPERRCL